MNVSEMLLKARDACRDMLRIDEKTNKKVLFDLADLAETETETLIQANSNDLVKMPESDPRYDRLLLTRPRIAAIADDIRNVANLPSPVDQILENRIMPNGLHLKKVRVPLGVTGVIYEARPNVTFDVFALCFRTGNVTVLKGSQDARESNLAIMNLIHRSLQKNGVSPEVAMLLPPERESASTLMNAVGLVDVLIPRGSQSLIDSVRNNSKVPVIETGAGVVHTYFDRSANLETGKKVIFNAKTRRVSVCNALDCLIIHADRLADLPLLLAPMAEKAVLLEADEQSFAAIQNHYPEKLLQKADNLSFGKEHLSLRLTIKTVAGIDEAVAHISRYGTRHSEAIIAEDESAQRIFCREVDAAAVYVNTSTAFTDGAQFGMGAEIGISTQKLHARGPMALPELTTYKWLVSSNGLTRP